MTGTLAIAAREIRERTFVFVTAAMISLMPFIVALLMPHGGGTPPASIIIITGAFAAAGLTIAVAIMLGSSIIGRELTEHRLSFYFSKPVSASAIWFGKLTGAFVIIVLCFAVTLLPSLLVAHGEWRTTWGFSIPFWSAVVLGCAASLLLTSHALATIVRSRSPLAALDLALFAAYVALAWVIVRPLMLSGAFGLTGFVAGVILLTLPLSILGAGWWQLSRGRTEIRSSHRQFSRFFWVAWGIVIAVTGAYVAWVFTAAPSDLKISAMAGNRRGDWFAISGQAPYRGDYEPTFLVDLKTGRSIRLPGGRLISPVAFTHGGDAVVMATSPDRISGRSDVRVYRLDPVYRQIETGVSAGMWSQVVASDDLRRLAVYESGNLSVQDLPSKTMMASVRIPFGYATGTSLFFVDDDTVRLYVRDSEDSNTRPVPHEIRIYEFDVRHRRLVQTGSVAADARMVFFRVSADGTTMFVSEYGGPKGASVHILDSRTGAERGVIESDVSPWITPLANGGAAYVSRHPASSMRIVDAHGTLVHDIPLGLAGFGSVSEVVPGKTYVVKVRNRDQGSTLLVVDAERGVVRRVEGATLRPELRGSDPRTPAANRSGEYAITGADDALWRWNALTGARTRVF